MKCAVTPRAPDPERRACDHGDLARGNRRMRHIPISCPDGFLWREITTQGVVRRAPAVPAVTNSNGLILSRRAMTRGNRRDVLGDVVALRDQEAFSERGRTANADR